jgi:hypothetical protein
VWSGHQRGSIRPLSKPALCMFVGQIQLYRPFFTSALDAPVATMPLVQTALVNVGVFATPNAKHTMKCMQVPSFGIWLPPTILAVPPVRSSGSLLRHNLKSSRRSTCEFWSVRVGFHLRPGGRHGRSATEAVRFSCSRGASAGNERFTAAEG